MCCERGSVTTVADRQGPLLVGYLAFLGAYIGVRRRGGWAGRKEVVRRFLEAGMGVDQSGGRLKLRRGIWRCRRSFLKAGMVPVERGIVRRSGRVLLSLTKRRRRPLSRDTCWLSSESSTGARRPKRGVSTRFYASDEIDFLGMTTSPMSTRTERTRTAWRGRQRLQRQ